MIGVYDMKKVKDTIKPMDNKSKVACLQDIKQDIENIFKGAISEQTIKDCEHDMSIINELIYLYS